MCSIASGFQSFDLRRTRFPGWGQYDISNTYVCCAIKCRSVGSDVEADMGSGEANEEAMEGESLVTICPETNMPLMTDADGKVLHGYFDTSPGPTGLAVSVQTCILDKASRQACVRMIIYYCMRPGGSNIQRMGM